MRFCVYFPINIHKITINRSCFSIPKCNQNDGGWGSTPGPTEGAYTTALPRPASSTWEGEGMKEKRKGWVRRGASGKETEGGVEGEPYAPTSKSWYWY